MRKLFSFFIFSFILLATTTVSCFATTNYTYSAPSAYEFNKFNPNGKSIDLSEKILFIVDLSNSMNERMGVKTKLDVALNTIRETLQELPAQANIGLRVYGHKTGFTPRQSCTASQLISPIQQNNAINIYTQLKSLDAVGWTPITYSLKQAVLYDFSEMVSKKRIILISDGGENCDESPCDYAIELMKKREDIRIDVIALALGDKDANNQLKCVSLVTSGKFYTANTAAELKDSLQDSLNLKKEVQAQIIKK